MNPKNVVPAHSDPNKRRDAPVGSGYSSLWALADDIEASRPTPNFSLEQFHMNKDSLVRQAQFLVKKFSSRRLLFLGDDDHLSVMVAAFSDISCQVYEIDTRIVEQLRGWSSRLHLRDFAVREHDIREPLPSETELCDAFYINPPYGSKNHGYSVQFWLTRAMEGCTPMCDGVVVLPIDEHLKWVDEVWVETQKFVTENGFRIVTHETDIWHMYERANDKGLHSANLVLRRVDPSQVKKVQPRAGSSLYR